jgi:hypothetical protein
MPNATKAARPTVCKKHDTAKALDPEGDDDPRVQRARSDAQGAMRRQ